MCFPPLGSPNYLRLADSERHPLTILPLHSPHVAPLLDLYRLCIALVDSGSVTHGQLALAVGGHHGVGRRVCHFPRVVGCRPLPARRCCPSKGLDGIALRRNLASRLLADYGASQHCCLGRGGSVLHQLLQD